MKNSHGLLDAVHIDPHEVKEHPLPHDDVKTQFYRRLLQGGQKVLPIVVEPREEGGYRLVDGIHRLGASQLMGKPISALVVRHNLQKMAIKDIRLGRRIAVNPEHFLGYTRYDYSHVLPSTLSSQGYRLNVYHDPTSAPNEERFVTAVLTHPKEPTTSKNFPHSVGTVSGHLQPDGRFNLGMADVKEHHRGGKGMPMYEALLAHASKKLGAHTVVGDTHSTMAHKVHQKLSLKHGMDYEAKPEDVPSVRETGPYDGKFGPYSYAIKNEEMAKAIAPFIASMMLAAAPGDTSKMPEQPKHEIAQTLYKPWTPEGLNEDLHPIAHLESSWGKNIAHGKGKSEMDTAFGALGFKPQTALEEYNRSKKIQKDHPGLGDPTTFLNEFRGNPGFYNKMASEHFARLKRLHGSAEKAAFAWRWGSTAAANVTPEQVEAEPYVQKYKALKSVKKLGKSQRDKEETRVVSVAAFRDGLMLFGLRGDKKKWCLPGGHMEPAEERLDAAKRELMEETGLEGHEWEYLGSGEPREGLTVYCYKCTVEDAPDASNDPDAEFIEFQWVSPDSIPQDIKENLYNKNDINLELQGVDYKVELAKMAAKKPKISPDQKNLVVTHNLSAGGLEHAHKLGGLPAPSLAITHKDHPLHGFGEITLVAPHHLADPGAHPVYDADIYSPRQPRAEFKYSDKKMSKLMDQLRPHFKAIGSDWVSGMGDEFKRYGPGMTRAGSYNMAEGMKHAYLKDKGVAIPEIQREKKISAPWVAQPAMQNFFKEHGKNSQYDHDSDYAKKLGEAARASIDSWSKNIDGMDDDDKKYLNELAHKEFINPENGEVWFSKSPRMFQDHSNLGQHEPDPYKMRDWVNAKVKEMGEDDFHDWAEKKLEPLNEGQYIPKYSSYSGNMRRVPYTIENILKEMKGNPRQGENFNYGLGSIRAGGAKKFKDVEQMRQHQGQIVSHEEFEKIKDHMNKRWDELNDELAPYHGSKMNSMSALGEAISESYKRGKYLGQQLKLSGYDHVPPEIQRKVQEFSQDLVRMPTEYFESKPQRVVGLHEFKGAAVPNDAHPRTIEHLKSNGINHIETYDKDSKESRRDAINRIAAAQNLHLSEDEFYGETLLKDLDWELAKSESVKMRIPLSNVFLLNRWGHPITPDRVDYHLQPGANTPPIKAVLGPEDLGEYVHSSDPQREEMGEAVPFDHKPLLNAAHPKYFVSDGHHRVRAAQQRGDTHIDAEIHMPETPYYLKGDKKARFESEVGSEQNKLNSQFGKSEGVNPAKSPATTKVWRVQNDAGQGPYESGAMVDLYGKFPKEEMNDEHLPASQEDFHPATYAAHKAGQAVSGFSDAKHAEKWFGPERLKALFGMGFKLQQMPAKKVWEGKSGKQVLFVPHNDAGLKKNEFDWFADDEPGTRILALKSAKPNPKLLEMALEDECPDVRYFAAMHPALSFEQLFSVLSHKDVETRLAALKNPGITEEHLDFAQHDPDIAWEVAQHPAKQAQLAKNIGFVEFPKMGSHVHTHPMPMTVPDAKDRKKLMGDPKKSVSGGKLFYNASKDWNKGVSGKRRKMSGFVTNGVDNGGIKGGDSTSLKGSSDHEAQHSVFAHLAQRHGVYAQHAAIHHVLGALSDREKTFLFLLNPQLKSYPQGQRGEEVIAYMQNFLQEPTRRKQMLADFAPNGRRLTEVGQRQAHQMVKDMWKRMRNRAHEFGPEHIEAYKAMVKKSDTELLENLPQLIKEANLIGYNVVEDMAGNSLIDQKVLKAVEFLSGKKCDMSKYRRAYWKTEDQYQAALEAVDLEPTQENVDSLKNIADLQDVKKNNIDDSIKQVRAVFPEDQKVAQAIQRGIDTRSVHAPELEGKHVGGIRTVTDPDSNEVFLLKPGSGAPSPAKGVKSQIASPSEREAAFYAVAKKLGLEDRMVETYLLNIDGKYVAAMRMLPHNWTNLEKLKFQNKNLPGSVLEKYRVTGELHTWAILDYILGNPDRHGQNLMVGPADDNYPIVLIDHGSALAGKEFDPAHDEDSFIPYYFRAWGQKAFKNTDDPSKKMKLMPKTSDAGRKLIEEFIMKLNPAELEGVLAKFGCDPSAALKRLEDVKHLLSNGLPLDEGVNKLWILGA